jgi:hypothetical protein
MTIHISLHGNSRSKWAVQAARYEHLGCSYEASVRAVSGHLHDSWKVYGAVRVCLPYLKLLLNNLEFQKIVKINKLCNLIMNPTVYHMQNRDKNTLPKYNGQFRRTNEGSTGERNFEKFKCTNEAV